MVTHSERMVPNSVCLDLGVSRGSIRNAHIDPYSRPLAYHRVLYPNANDCTGTSVTEVLGYGDCSSATMQRFYPKIQETAHVAPSSLEEFRSVAFRLEEVAEEESKWSGSIDWSPLLYWEWWSSSTQVTDFWDLPSPINAQMEYTVGDHGAPPRPAVTLHPSCEAFSSIHTLNLQYTLVSHGILLARVRLQAARHSTSSSREGIWLRTEKFNTETMAAQVIRSPHSAMT